ncbi:MAG: HIT family protein [Microscillaceae bacterium]
MPSIFTKIIHGEIPSHQIAENEDYFAFLDIQPIVEGHTLVIPKLEIDYIFDLDNQTLMGLHLFAKKIALALRQTFDCARVSLIVAGFEVPHAHIHLIPSNSMDDLSFAKRSQPRPEQLADTAARIRAQLRLEGL